MTKNVPGRSVNVSWELLQLSLLQNGHYLQQNKINTHMENISGYAGIHVA